MGNRPVTIELERDEGELLLMALSLARNSPEMHREHDLDAIFESVRRQVRGDAHGPNGVDEP